MPLAVVASFDARRKSQREARQLLGAADLGRL